MARFHAFSLLFLAICALCACQSSRQEFTCTDAIGCITIAPNRPLKLGVIQTLSGGSAPGGMEQVQSIEIAIARRDEQFSGHPIELQIEDDQCSPEGGANAALRIIADSQVVAIFGTNCSGAAVTAGKLVSRAGLVMISSSNTAPDLTAVNGQPGENWQAGYFRTIYSDALAGEVAAEFAFEELNLTKAVTINNGDDYTTKLAGIFAQSFEIHGGEIVADITIDVDQSDFSPVILIIKNSGAELVFMPLGQPELAAHLVKQIRQSEALQQIRLIGGEGLLSEVFIEAAGDEGIGVYMVGRGPIQSEANDSLRQEYKERYGEFPPSFYHSFTYDAVNLVLDTLEKVAIRDGDGTLHIGRQALRDALYATRQYHGLTGDLSCDESGDCSANSLQVVQLENPAGGLEALEAHVIYRPFSN